MNYRLIKSPLSAKKINSIIITVLKQEKAAQKGPIHVAFVDNQTLRALSRRFLKKDHNTDVIAFPYTRTKHDKESPFGDIFISVPQAKQNAKRYNDTFERELKRLLIHGVLHLLGYSDEHPSAKIIMWEHQEALLKKCG